MSNFRKLRETGERPEGIPHLNEVAARPVSQSAPEYPYPDDDTINLVECWRVLVSYRKLIAAVTIAGIAFSLFTAWHMTPMYRAQVLLAPVLNENRGLSGPMGQLGELAALAGYNFREEDNNVAEAIAALNSRSLSVAFLREEDIVRAMFPERWDAEQQDWRSDFGSPSDWDVFRKFENIRMTNVDRGSGLITLTLEWKDPELAAQWANSLVKRVNDRLRQEAITESEKSIEYLKEQLAATGVVEVQQAIYRLIEAQTKKKMLASTREEYAFKVIDPAVAPSRNAPVGPQRSSLVISGIVFGLMAGVLVAFFVHMLRLHMKRAGPA